MKFLILSSLSGFSIKPNSNIQNLPHLKANHDFEQQEDIDGKTHKNWNIIQNEYNRLVILFYKTNEGLSELARRQIETGINRIRNKNKKYSLAFVPVDLSKESIAKEYANFQPLQAICFKDGKEVFNDMINVADLCRPERVIAFLETCLQTDFEISKKNCAAQKNLDTQKTANPDGQKTEDSKKCVSNNQKKYRDV